jgi:ferrochelatase
MARTAVVLFNLGAPDSLAAVTPFLFNLFSDPAIITVPRPFRWLLARLIVARRAPVARSIYGRLGGGSPLLELTREQATALQAALADLAEVRVFVCMRYWHPMSAEVVGEVVAWQPEQILLLPLYPQFSTTTTASSLGDWARAARAARLSAPATAIGCYPTLAGLVRAYGELIGERLSEAAAHGTPRLLFSAHGLPKKVVAGGDPYQWQVEQTAQAIAAGLDRDGLDWRVCYQSRVGRLEWLGPSTGEEIERAGRERVPLVVVPIAFVSEHSETLVELDVTARRLADEMGVPWFVRVPAVGTHPLFISGLADLVRDALGRPGPRSQQGRRICPAAFRRCICIGDG